MQTRIKGIREGGSGEELNLKAGVRGDLHISDYLPKYSTLTSLGRGMIAGCTTAIASLQVIPTTTAAISLFNGEAAGGKSYCIDRFFLSAWASGSVAAGGLGLWACIHHVGHTAPTATLTVDTLDGDPYGGLAIVDVDATVHNDVWYPWSTNAQFRTADIDNGGNLGYDVEGRIVIKPTYAISLHAVSPDSGITVKLGLSWFEVQIDIA